MDELIALLERYSPGYREKLQGIDDWCLEDLEEALGRPLPGFYRKFAKVMGQQAGPLLAHVTQEDLPHVMFLYRVTPELPRRFLLLFGDPDPLAPNPYWLDLDAPSEDGDCQVVRMPFGENESSWKERLSRDYLSLREMLFLWAMEDIHLPNFSHQARYNSGQNRQPPTAEDLASLFKKMGFVQLPYPRHSMLFEREEDGAAIRLYRPPDDSSFEIRAGMRNAQEFKRFKALIEDNTDLEVSIW